jgi:hypothetical protein
MTSFRFGLVITLASVVLGGAGCVSVGSEKTTAVKPVPVTNSANPKDIATSAACNESGGTYDATKSWRTCPEGFGFEAVSEKCQPTTNQEMKAECDALAQKKLDDHLQYNQNSTLGSRFKEFTERHYFNDQQKVCFVMLIDSKPNLDKVAVYGTNTLVLSSETLFDANVDKELAKCTSYSSAPSDSIKYSCYVGSKEVSLQEYQDYIKQRMEISQ